MKQLFKSYEVCKLLDISLGQLHRCIQMDYLKPSIKALGQGSKHIFTKNDLNEINLYIGFRKFGFHRWISSQLTYKNKFLWEFFLRNKSWLVIKVHKPCKRKYKDTRNIKITIHHDLSKVAMDCDIMTIMDLHYIAKDTEERINALFN